MKTLFIDSSKKRLSVALANSNELLFVSNVDSYSRHSNFLMKEIINVLNKTNFTIYDVDNIVVLNGPGSFTGVRVGVTIAKTLAWVLSKKIYSLTTLEALALQDSDNSNIICSIFDKPKAGYLGIYLDDYKDENYYTIEEASKLVTNKEVTIVCLEEDDFTMNLYKELQNKNIVTLKVIDNYDYLKVINKALLTPSLNPHSVKPIYLKKIDVEKKKY